MRRRDKRPPRSPARWSNALQGMLGRGLLYRRVIQIESIRSSAFRRKFVLSRLALDAHTNLLPDGRATNWFFGATLIRESVGYQRHYLFRESFHLFHHRAHLHQKNLDSRFSKLDNAFR